ncbi:MAG: 50S ribosomal protein L19e [Candidatus Aenigmarchaeota archaeon]|nr:50S ribosomal protein L19e [Candidatus Aenigmarchaeota archaeon]
MNLKHQKEITARKLKVGINRVHIDPDNADDIKEAITGDDIRSFVSQGLITIKKIRGQSHAKARDRESQKKKGRQKGHGNRQGTANARLSDKDKWIKKIRALRKELREMRDKESITIKEYRQLYIYARSGMFRSKKHMKLHLSKTRESGEKK